MIRKNIFCLLALGLGAWYVWMHARLYYLYHYSDLIFYYQLPDYKLFLACLAGVLFCIASILTCIKHVQAMRFCKGVSITLVGIALSIALTAKHGLIEEFWTLFIYLLAAIGIFILPNLILTEKINSHE